MITDMVEGVHKNVKLEVRVKTKSGKYIWNAIRGGLISDLNNNPIRIIGTNSDITELIEQKDRNIKLQIDLSQKESDFEVLKEVSSRDPLTGVYNRRFLQEFKVHRGDKYSIAMLDLDHFKIINDTYGHAVGEEFVIIFTDSVVDGAHEVCEKIRYNIEMNPHTKVGIQTISTGLTCLKTNNDLEVSLKRADTALYEAKHAGRNKVIIAKD